MTRRNGPLAALVVTGLVIPLTSGCGGTTGQRPAPIGALAACRLLRADARTAIQDIGHGSSPDIAFALLHDECARVGITIWPSASGA